jgi:hypothetical protein
MCSNKLFWNIFNFCNTHHYTHNTLKLLYKFKDKYDITFKLLKPDEKFNYNFVWYEHTVELKKVFKGWFKIMDQLLKTCSKDNYLVKTYISQAWGNLSKFNKTYETADTIENCDWDHLDNIDSTNRYDMYCYEHSNGIYTMIPSKKAFKNGGISRIKMFLTEFSRGYIFNMISSNDLAGNVLRIQTDSISFNQPVDFPSMGLDYFPIPEGKSTGHLKFYNVNSYFHVCPTCNFEYKHSKHYSHECNK